jgi:hypothetical protein
MNGLYKVQKNIDEMGMKAKQLANRDGDIQDRVFSQIFYRRKEHYINIQSTFFISMYPSQSNQSTLHLIPLHLGHFTNLSTFLQTALSPTPAPTPEAPAESQPRNSSSSITHTPVVFPLTLVFLLPNSSLFQSLYNYFMAPFYSRL